MPAKQLDLFREIIVDNFAGGGGASTGIELATGLNVDIAINHDPDAIAMHKANHPETKHYCESVWDVDPKKACEGRPVGLCWLSPDCKHFSKAKGGKPVEKKIRGLAWIAVRWAKAVRPRVIMLENVEEFKTWGPLTKDNKPDPQRKGQTFHAFVKALNKEGYKVEFKKLRACDYGAPTIRRRFFLIARCDGQPITWPEPTHGDPNSQAVKKGRMKPWRTASEIIDWSLPCPSIFDTFAEIKNKYGLKAKRPLAENTLKRIARGIQKFVIDNPEPFIINVNHTSSKNAYDCFRGQSIDDPMNTITSHHGFGIVTPVLAVNNMHNTGSAADHPVKTITTGGHHMVVTPVMTAIGQTGFSNNRGYAVDEPVRTVVSKAEQCLIAPTLVQYHGETDASEVRGQDLTDALLTVDSANRYALVAPFLSKYFSSGYTGAGSTFKEPFGTVTSVDHNALVTSHLVQLNHHSTGQTIDEPINTVTAGAGHFGEVRAFLMKYYGTGIGQTINRPLDTVVSKERFGVIEIHGTPYQIVDIGMRMLTPRELFDAQGFPHNYIIDHDFEGKTYPKSKQVARCGNAVPPQFVEALVRANMPELCVKKYQWAVSE
ncbi:DNA cytosine methyltransferase [Sporolactobacillus pectinivorans]|uniref:DNA cytosine methyltransferase n=1 Tax=Sporolactobacillus pectinivorans TaxID=1591408 RepID=UPI001EFDCB7C